MVVLAATLLSLWPGAAVSREICDFWARERLVIAPELDGARLILEARGKVETMPPYGMREERPVIHRTFGLAANKSRGGADELDVFAGCEPHDCLLAPSYSRRPLKIPVFFIGKPGQSYADFKGDIERFGFGSSWRVRRFMDFSRVQFTHKSGPGYLDDFQPFFQCGLPGLLVCARECPPRGKALRRSLLNWVLSGETWTPPEERRERAAHAPERDRSSTPFNRGEEKKPDDKKPEQTTPEEKKPEQPAATKEAAPAPAPQPAPAPAPPAPAAPKPAEPKTEPAGPKTVPLHIPQPAPPAPEPPAPKPVEPPPAEPAQPVPAPTQAPEPPPAEPAPAPAPAQPATPAPAPEPQPQPEPQPKPEPQPQPSPAGDGPDRLSVRIFSPEALQSGEPAAALTNLQIRAQVSCEVAADATYTTLPKGEGEVAFDRAEAERMRRVCLILKTETPLGRACQVLPYTPGTIVAPLQQFTEANCAGRQQLTLALRAEDGSALSGETVLLAEGGLSYENAPFTVMEGDLVANLSVDGFRKAVAEGGLAGLFKQHRLVRQRFENGKLVITLEPRYIQLSELVFRVLDSAERSVPGCSFLLTVPEARRLGDGWGAVPAEGIEFRPAGGGYRAVRSSSIMPDRLLVATAEDGTAASLKSANAACPLAQAPEVTASELRGLSVRRTVQPAGPILIAMVSADRGLAVGLPTDAIDSYWSSALGFIDTVGQQPWETKILAWTQAPGRLATRVWRSVTGSGSIFANDQQKADYVRTLSDLSGEQPIPTQNVRAIIGRQIGNALDDVRQIARIREVESVRREHLVILSGALQQNDSPLCRGAIRGNGLNGAVKDSLRRALVIELWSQPAVEAMRNDAEKVPSAELYRCKIGGELGQRLKLFGVAVPAGLGTANLERIFNALRNEAEGFLDPAAQ